MQLHGDTAAESPCQDPLYLNSVHPSTLQKSGCNFPQNPPAGLSQDPRNSDPGFLLK